MKSSEPPRIQQLNGTRDLINSSINNVGNVLMQQMQQQEANNEQNEIEQQQQRSRIALTGNSKRFNNRFRTPKAKLPPLRTGSR